MNHKKTIVLSTIVTLLPMILSCVLFSKLPDQVAVHWNNAGEANNYLPKAVAAFGLPALLAVLNLIANIKVLGDPKVGASAKVLRVASCWLIPILSVIIMPVTLFMALGYEIPIHIIVPAVVGVLILLCGNYLPKCRQNYTIGIKLPWTLANEVVWNKTHRFAGYLWMLGGASMIVISCLQVRNVMWTIGILGVLVVVPFVYSIVVSRE